MKFNYNTVFEKWWESIQHGKELRSQNTKYSAWVGWSVRWCIKNKKQRMAYYDYDTVFEKWWKNIKLQSQSPKYAAWIGWCAKR